MNRSRTLRHRRPVRFNRTRANPMQRLPFYRQSHAGAGDYWRMPTVQGYLMGREVGKVCSVAFVQALHDGLKDKLSVGDAHLAETIRSAVEANGGVLTAGQRGLIEGFFGRGSKLMDIVRTGIKSLDGAPRYEMEQIEAALTELSSMTVEEYALSRIGSISAAIPDSVTHPRFSLE